MLAWIARHFPFLRPVPLLPQMLDAALLAGTVALFPRRARSLHEIEREATSWPGVVPKSHRYGGTEFQVAGREIGHLHSHGLLDVPFPKALRDEIVAAGQAKPHHIFPRSGWVSFFVHAPSDAPGALALLRRSYAQKTASLTPHPSALTLSALPPAESPDAPPAEIPRPL